KLDHGSIGGGAQDVKVNAVSDATISAIVDATTLSRQIGVGVVLAFNTIGVEGQNIAFNIADVVAGTGLAERQLTDGQQVQAHITGTTITAHDIDVTAQSAQHITSDISNSTKVFRIGVPSVGDDEPTGTSATVNAVIALNRIAAVLDASIVDSASI